MKLRQAFFAFIILLVDASAVAQAPRGTLVHEATLHIAPDAQSAKLSEVARGHELIILETSRDWAHVQAIISEPRKDRDEDDEESQGKTISGWVSGKALVSNATSNGDKIIFGEAADSENNLVAVGSRITNQRFAGYPAGDGFALRFFRSEEHTSE